MILESVETINKRLLDYFGRFNTTDLPLWRVVWSEDQFEKRETEYSDEGFQLLQPEVRLLPKYRQWVHNKYILERCLSYPEEIERDVVDKITYEPVWVFQDAKENALPPKWEAIEVLITQVYKQAAKTTGQKYSDPDAVNNSKEALELRRDKVNKMVEDLFGNETDTGVSLAYKEGISVPSNYTKQEIN